MTSRADLSGLPHTATSQTFVIHPDGSISVPLTQVGSIVWPRAAQLRQTVHVPAGTYQATVINETMTRLTSHPGHR